MFLVIFSYLFLFIDLVDQYVATAYRIAQTIATNLPVFSCTMPIWQVLP